MSPLLRRQSSLSLTADAFAREPSQEGLKHAPSAGPVDVRPLTGGASLDPSKALRELADADGLLELRVSLATEVRVGPDGAPAWGKGGEWRDAAFGHSAAAKARVESAKVTSVQSSKRKPAVHRTLRGGGARSDTLCISSVR